MNAAFMPSLLTAKPDYQHMDTQLIAILIVLFLALGILFLAWFVLAAVMLSSEISESERQADALKAMGWQQWPNDNTEEPDNA